MTINAIKILLPTIISFGFGFLISPWFIKVLNKYAIFKKRHLEKALDGTDAVETKKIHKDDYKSVPRMGGAVIWGSVLFTALLFWILTKSFNFIPEKIDFISRNQTWLIIFGMVFSGMLGALDDLSTAGKKILFIGDKGLSFLWRLLVVFILSLFIGYWFYFKLGFTEIFIPFYGMFFVGILIIPLISFFTVMMFGTSNIDGIDGLSGGLFAIAFASYGLIALSQSQIDIAAFCFAMVGGCVAFLWYNIMPARYYNSETGILALTTSLTLVAFLTNQIFSLIIIALPLLTAPVSAVLQIISKKYLGRKIFIVAPLHHHFQAKGSSTSTVVMKFWLFGIMCAFIGVVLSLAGSL